MKLTKKARAARVAVTAALALPLAGSAAVVAASALQLAVPAPSAYLPALLSVALCVCGTLSGGGAIIASLALVAVTSVYAATNAAGIAAMRAVFASWTGAEVDAAAIALGGGALLTCAAFALGALFFALLNRRESVSAAIIAELSILTACHAMSASASLSASLPGLIAAAGAFALTGGVQREAAALRVLIPAALAVLIAAALLPAGHRTWAPMERAANRVRDVFEQYFRFTRERVAFSINEQGYDHAGEMGDSVVAMLGGPAQPHTDPVMSVHTDAEVLLRGTIRTAYTGWSWVDAEPKSRYLYYDLTHRSIRDQVFLPSDALKAALPEVGIDVEMLYEGTSTLFVPGLLEQFDMDLSTAVYYNTAGEVFLSRSVRPGDAYRLRALRPELGEALRRIAIEGEQADDGRYPDILAAHTGLPDGIDGKVYTLTAQVVRDADSAWDRAVAIMEYLRSNMRYTLRPDYPPRGKDFVSHFLLDSREGYCSYYATAMAVMGRIAGLPTRYVEGFLARPGAEALTGEDAHAWAEVYFRGVGWIPFDATGGTAGGGAGWSAPRESGEAPGPEGADGGQRAAGENTTAAEGESIPPEAAPESDPPSDGGAPQTPPPTPEPQPGSDAPEEGPDRAPSAPERRGVGWLWRALLLLLVAALAAWATRWTRGRLRRSDPAALCAGAKTLRQASLVLYRANLTVLSFLGQTPDGGEAPQAFADRVSKQLGNPDYAAFVRAVTNAGYGRQPLRRADVDAGLRAFERFRAALGWRERLRFLLSRIFRGLGDFDAIP